MQHIIFDLDGTIIDSKREILKTYKIVFDNIPPSIPPDIDNLNYGLNINDLLKGVYGVASNDIPQAKKMFASIYDNSDYLETTLYDGVEDTLELLKQQGDKLYIATNKRYIPTMRILEKKNLLHFFSNVVANEVTPGIILTKREMIATLKLQGSFSEGYMVGDSTTDIEAGIQENLMTVAVKYGYEKPEMLAKLEPTILIDTFRNLFTFVQIHKKL